MVIRNELVFLDALEEDFDLFLDIFLGNQNVNHVLRSRLALIENLFMISDFVGIKFGLVFKKIV